MKCDAQTMMFIAAMGVVALLCLKLAEMGLVLLAVVKAIQTMNYIADLQTGER